MTAVPLITVRLGDQPQTLPRDSSLADLVTALGHAPNAITTAVNGQFVARGARGAHVLMPDDAVLLFQPIVGG